MTSQTLAKLLRAAAAAATYDARLEMANIVRTHIKTADLEPSKKRDPETSEVQRG